MRIEFFFFFSSRRRHTRCYRDWSSDVCSSDLIVGVAPPGFFGFEVGRKPDIWWPIKAANDETSRQMAPQDNLWWLLMFGRLRPGVSMAQAQSEVAMIFRRRQEEIAGESAANWTPTERREHF